MNVLTALALGLALFAWSAQEPGGTVRVEVRVAGKPIADAQVTAGTVTASTDPNGVAVLAVPPGPATIVVSKATFVSVTVDVAVTAGSD